MRLRTGMCVMIVALHIQASGALAVSKNAEKGLFIGGLLALGAVVHSLEERDTAHSESQHARWRGEFGEPVTKTAQWIGFDERVTESYRGEKRRLRATFRNGRLVDVRDDWLAPQGAAPGDADVRAAEMANLAPSATAEDGFDRRLFRTVHEDMRWQPLVDVISVTDELGSSKVILAGTALAIVAGTDEIRDTGLLVGASFVASSGVTWLLKRVIGRPRPLTPEDKHSMPSGHATNAFAVATVLSDRYPSWRIPLYGLAATVAFGRVYLGRHYPSDVLAGAAIGTGMARLVTGAEDDILSIRF